MIQIKQNPVDLTMVEQPQPRQQMAVQMLSQWKTRKKVFVKNQYHGAFGGTTKFEGRIEILKTAVYDFIGILQPELYVRTTREIADYVGKPLRYYGIDAKQLLNIWNYQ